MNAMNLYSGTFTTPISGTYAFTFTSMTGYIKSSHIGVTVEVWKNNSRMHSYFDNDTSAHNWITGSWMFHMKKGDTVRLKVVGDKMFVAYDWRTHFTGLLIKADY